MMTSQIIQVSVKFDLQDKIKEAQQKNVQTAQIVEKVQRGETQDFIIKDGLLRKGYRDMYPRLLIPLQIP